MKKRIKLLTALIISLTMMCGMSITAFALPTINAATINAYSSPVYTGQDVDPVNFEIEVCLDSTTLSAGTDYELKFYSDEALTTQATPHNAGVYYVIAEGRGEYEGTTAPVKIKVLKAYLPKPEAVSGLVYDGTEKTGVQFPAGAATSRYSVSGDKATEVGAYSATVSLADSTNYCWAGESSDPEETGTSQPININYAIRPVKGPEPEPNEVDPKAEEKEEESSQVNEENISVNPVVIDKSFVSQGDEPVIPGSAYNFSNIKTMKGFATQVTKIAAKNTAAKSIEVYSSKPMCFNRELLTSINGTGKSFVYYFTHKGHLYSVTVPAGADPSAILNKGQLEGPLYIGKVLGTTRLIK